MQKRRRTAKPIAIACTMKRVTLGSGTVVNLTETPVVVVLNVPFQPAAAISGAKAKVLGDGAEIVENDISG